MNMHIQKATKLISGIVLIFWAMYLLPGCKNEIKAPDEKVKYTIPDSLLRTLKIDTVRQCPLLNAVTLTGMVDFDQDKQVNIFSLVSGIVDDVKVQLGDYVNEGQTLAVVKSSEMAGYNNNLVVAETNLRSTAKQLDASKELYKSGLASQLDVTTAQANYDQAVAQLEMVKKVLKINGNNTNGEYIIKAPISGFIVQKNITSNSSIRSDNSANLFTISDLKEVWVQANVYEANIDQVHQGDDADVRTLADPDKVHHGKVDKILNVLDPASRVIKVRIALPNPDYSLKPQMFASVTVSDPEHKLSLCVPAKALIYDNSQYYVLVYKGKGEAEITPVNVFNSYGDKTYLNSGVKAGDLIIASQALQMYGELNN